MQVYRRSGHGEVVWLLIPVPRSPAPAKIVAADNAAVRLAARRLSHVTVLDLGAIFTPDGAFHQSIRHDGRLVRVRASDGLHLTAAGQGIAADAVRTVVDRDGLLE